MRAGTGREWFREWFGETYLDLYPHRDEAEAERAVRLLAELCPVEGGRALDLACGGGRHLGPLRAAGWRPVGLDLSRALLGRARDREGGRAGLVRGDMRILPFGAGSFSAVAQFFTSFGYFATREEDAAVLGEVARVLHPGGCALLDFLHADHVRSTLVPEDETTVDGTRVRQERRIEGDAVVKRIEIEPGATGGPERVFHERVRLYEPEELEAMMERAGLRVTERRGDYGGGRLGPGSTRVILLGRAK